MQGHATHASPGATKKVQPPPPYPEPRESSAFSPLEKARQAYEPVLPRTLEAAGAHPRFEPDGEPTTATHNPDEIKELFPHSFGRRAMKMVPSPDGAAAGSDSGPVRVACVLSGGPAAGGHNVIVGLFEAIKLRHKDSRLFGFTGGPKGIITKRFIEIDAERAAMYKNMGGFDMIGTGRDKIEKPEEFAASLQTVTDLDLDGLVVIGGDDSNTNAAVLAEYFMAQGNTKCTVVGCPKTIDCDLKNDYVEVSFGFDSAIKAYSEVIGNIATDSNSAMKYWHFVRLMGRAASHITLECALQTQPNICLIGEEVFAEDKSLAEITADMCDVICERATSGRNFGVVLVPEGLIEFIPEMNRLLAALNELLAQGIGQEYIRAKLASFRGTEREPVTEQEAGKLCDLYDFLPQQIRHELLLDRDPHGNVQVSKIETEKLLIELITTELKRRKGLDAYCGNFAAISHFFGYEGRCGLPSNFDATYCYTLGRTAAAVMFADLSGYMAVARYLAKPAQEWEPYAIPLTAMMRTERRAGKWKPVIEKALVDLEGAPFKKLVDNRAKWAAGEFYRSPGPKQFFGDLDKPSHTLTLESELRYPGL